MRAARFQAQLGFTIDPSTLYALKSRSPELDTISRERIRDELVKLITGEFAFDGLITLVVTGLMNNIIPELMKGMGLFHCNKPIDVLEHNLITCKMVKNTMLLRITALLHDIGKPFSVLQTEKGLKFPNHHIKSAQIAEKVLMDLRFSRHTINKAVTLIQNHMFRYPLDSSLPDARRLISKVGWDNIYDLIEIRKADRLASGFESAIGKETAKLIQHLEIIKDENSSYRIKDLAIDGDDLINNYHLPPGPHIKEILTKLLDMVIENPKLNKKEVLLDIVREKLLRKLGDTCKHL
jgi:tRNA nucleotidyltransferase (CCA-adding enzyme)